MKSRARFLLLAVLLLPLFAHADGKPEDPVPPAPPPHDDGTPAPAPNPDVDPNDPPRAPDPGPALPACSFGGKDISSDSAAILEAIKGSEFCWQAVQLAENCAGGEAYDINYVNVAAPKCQKEFEAHKPTGQDRALLQTMRAACDAKWKNLPGGQYQSINAYCKLKAWQWMANLTSENGLGH